MRQLKSTNHELLMRISQTLVKRPDERTKEDDKRVTHEWELKPKLINGMVASETKDKGRMHFKA